MSAIFVLVAIAAAFGVSRRSAGARVAVRIVGSGVMAMLMLGWGLRGI